MRPQARPRGAGPWGTRLPPGARTCRRHKGSPARATARGARPRATPPPSEPSDPGAAFAAGTAARATPADPTGTASAFPAAGDRVTLQLGGENGLDGRLRVAVRGQSVRATIVSTDAETVRRLGND